MDSPPVSFPLQLPASRVKRSAKVLLGRLLGMLDPKRMRQLERGEVAHPFGPADRLRVAALVDRHLAAGTMDRLAPIQQRFWAGGQARTFHAEAETRFETSWLKRHSTVAEWVRSELERSPGRYSTLVEIGCGSGLVLTDIAKRLPQIGRFVGIDLSEEQTKLNRERFVDPRLEFVSGEAAAWIEDNLQPGTIVFTNAGVLEYFPTEKLDSMIRAAAARTPSMIALIEPMANDFDPDTDSEPRTYSSENSLSRPYVWFLTRHGFTVRNRDYEQLPRHRRLMCLASKEA